MPGHLCWAKLLDSKCTGTENLTATRFYWTSYCLCALPCHSLHTSSQWQYQLLFFPLMVGAGLPNTSGTFPWSITSISCCFRTKPSTCSDFLMKQLLPNPNSQCSIPQAPLLTLAQTPPVLSLDLGLQSLSLMHFQPLSPWGPLGSLYPYDYSMSNCLVRDLPT